MKMTDLKKMLGICIDASLRAGEEILQVYKTDFSVERKEDRSPLTLADKNSHKIISEILSATGIPVLSEEGKDIPFSERKSWKRLWIVDPLDGTKEFVKRNGEFTVNISLVEDGLPVLGIIYVPVTGILYFAAEGLGAFRIPDPARIRQISGAGVFSFEKLLLYAQKLPLQHSPGKYTVVASRSHLTRETEDFILNMKKKYGEVEIISAGSSLKFCLVAEGKASVYPRFGPTMEWDTAAGQAIVRCAGKQVTDFRTGTTLVYNKEDLHNGWFVVE